MKYKVVRDRALRAEYGKKEENILKLKSYSENQYLDLKIREKYRIMLAKKGGMMNKIRNRCIISGRSRGVLRDMKISRMVFKEYAVKGKLAGVRKASW